MPADPSVWEPGPGGGIPYRLRRVQRSHPLDHECLDPSSWKGVRAERLRSRGVYCMSGRDSDQGGCRGLHSEEGPEMNLGVASRKPPRWRSPPREGAQMRREDQGLWRSRFREGAE